MITELTKHQLNYINLMGIDSYIGALDLKIKDLNEVIWSKHYRYYFIDHHFIERANLLNLRDRVKKYKHENE